MALTARALKRKELKALKEKGFNLAKMNQDNDTQEVVDAVLDIAFAENIAELDELEYCECMELFKKVVALTFGTEVQEKN